VVPLQGIQKIRLLQQDRRPLRHSLQMKGQERLELLVVRQ
jgi:hypothetical protein